MKHKQRMEKLLFCLDKTLLVIANTMVESSNGIMLEERVRLQGKLAHANDVIHDVLKDIEEENKYHPPVCFGDEDL